VSRSVEEQPSKRAFVYLRETLSNSRWALAVAAVHCFTFDLAVDWVSCGGDRAHALAATVAAFVAALPIVYLLDWLGSAGRLLIVIILLVDGITAYLSVSYRVEIRADALALLYNTDAGEAGELVGAPLIICALVSATLPFLLARVLPKRKDVIPWTRRALTLLVLLAVGAGAVTLRGRNYLRMPPQLPYVTVDESLIYFREAARLREISAHAINLGRMGAIANDPSVTAVLVIGEAARADRFSLNHYSRRTNPQLEQLGVVSFPHASACANATHLAVPCILTRNGPPGRDDRLPETSFVSVAAAAGFDTAWISNTRTFQRSDTVITSFAAESRHVWFSRQSYNAALDANILQPLAKWLHAPPQSIVIHTRGSHWEYAKRTDAPHAPFLPLCEASFQWQCDRRSLDNSYDDSIVYTDFVLASIIRQLRDRSAFLIYISDHGESLGEKGYFGHGQTISRPEQLHVPLIFWASPRWRSRYPQKWSSVLRHGPHPIDQSAIFHSMLDCAAVSSPVIDAAKSICSSSAAAAPTPRPTSR
jgi:glucan phosphoethanolaminetransferase (alkaline phosphatase superfamily)